MNCNAELILRSSCVFTAAGEDPFEGYVAVKDGKILAVGRGECPAELAGPETKVLDLGDRTVSPGFTDVHCFFSGYSVGFVGADLSAASSEEELFALVAAYAASHPGTGPLFGHGWNAELLHPAGTEVLDDLMGSRPCVLFAAGGETCWMNTAAIEQFRFTPETCWPESYVRIFPYVIGDKEFIQPEFRRYMAMMNSHGVTSVKEMGFDDFYGFTETLEQFEKDGELTLRVGFMSQPVAAPANFAYGEAMRDKFRGEFVRFQGYNQMTDGSVSQLCADLKQPYLCADTCCAQDIDWETIAAETREADRRGFRFSLHTQGDAAIAKTLDIYETCLRDGNGKMVNRQAMTDLEFSDPADLERMGKMGVVAEVYPQIQSIADREGKLAMIAEKIGMERGKNYWNRRKMVDSGVTVCCGTDLPLLIDNVPESVYHAVGGYFPEGGEPFNPQNMLTVKELMTAWTYGGAYDLQQEDVLGTLEAGKKADIAVLDGNIFTAPLETVRQLNVCLTLLGGRTVYSTL